ncbi:MAG TPA: type II toxin-antitoxin system VapC family toxin [Geminicoccaceae bacterium]|nr:type II toxin-antitoxin system VapC family toxin [Geminicoccaceae bacterium]
MIITDVNVLVYAYRAEAVDHASYWGWLDSVANGDETFALSGLVLSGFVRVVTHPRVFRPPSPIDDALGFAEDLLNQPNCVVIRPGPRHWGLFARLCRENGATGNLVPDAYLAALAIEAGCELVTTDRDFARFEGLRWRHPLA